MSGRQRLTMLAIAAVIAIAAFVVLRSGDDADPGETAATPTATATATPTAAATESPGATATDTPAATPSPTPTPRPTVDPGPLLTAESVTRINVDKGDTVRFRVRSETDDEVHVHGYDIKRDAPAGRTIRMAFKATIDGIFEIEFEESATEIGSLRVDPS